MDYQTTTNINENRTRFTTAMDETTAVEQLPVPPPAETQLQAPMTSAVQQQPLSSTPMVTPRTPSPTLSQMRSSLLIFDLSSLLQCQTSEIHPCNAVHTPAHKLRKRRHAKSQLPQSPHFISQSSPQLRSRPQCLKRGRLLFQTIRSSNQLSHRRHQRCLRHPLCHADLTAFAQHHNVLDMTTLKAMETLLLQGLGSLRKMA